MIEARHFVDGAIARGYSFWSGVPCSFLTPLINYVIQDERLTYIGAASEGEAVAIAAGGYLAGRKTVVICQNSGLGNTVNPLTSLNDTFQIPTLLIVTHRGRTAHADEPQHALMGAITQEMLTLLRIPWEDFPRNFEDVGPALERANLSMEETHRPYAFVMQQNSVSECRLNVAGDTTPWVPGTITGAFTAVADRIPRRQATEIIRERCDGATALIATTGKIGRELEALGHRNNQLYVVGSLGCASAIALGINKASGRRVIVLDGDGAVLMKMGVLGTIGRHASRGFVHVILDNEAHESTGAQATVSSSMDFCTIAVGCGYRNSWRVDSAQTLAAALDRALVIDGPNLIHVKVAIATDRHLKRPSLTPTQVKQQFSAWLTEPESAAHYAGRGVH